MMKHATDAVQRCVRHGTGMVDGDGSEKQIQENTKIWYMHVLISTCDHNPPTSQTDRWTDDMRSRDRALHYSASRGNNNNNNNNNGKHYFILPPSQRTYFPSKSLCQIVATIVTCALPKHIPVTYRHHTLHTPQCSWTVHKQQQPRCICQQHLTLTGLDPVSDLIIHRWNSVFGHIARLSEDTPAHQALWCHIDLSLCHLPKQGWRRRPGHPSNWWINQLRRDNNTPPADLWRRSIKHGYSGVTLQSLPNTR